MKSQRRNDQKNRKSRSNLSGAEQRGVNDGFSQMLQNGELSWTLGRSYLIWWERAIWNLSKLAIQFYHSKSHQFSWDVSVEKYVLKLCCLTNKEICNQRISKEPSSNDEYEKKEKQVVYIGSQPVNLIFMSEKNVLGAGIKPPLTIMKRLFRKQKKYTGRHPEEQTLWQMLDVFSFFY